jgi:hypothetical protein
VPSPIMTASAKPTGSTPPLVLRYFMDWLLTRACLVLVLCWPKMALAKNGVGRKWRSQAERLPTLAARPIKLDKMPVCRKRGRRLAYRTEIALEK